MVVAVLVGVLWQKYDKFLSQGQQPPPGTKILNEMEKSGVPDFSLNDLSGQPVKLSQFSDKIVIVNFWASWCEPCVEEFPSLLSLIDHFKGQVILLAISADFEKVDLENFLKAFDAKDPSLYVMWDKDQEVAKLFGTEVLPESYIVGRERVLVRKIAGVDNWYTPDAIEFFNTLVSAQ